MVRVIAGKAKGRKLVVPDIAATRPVTDRIKTVVFDLLRDNIAGANILDLYSGSGAYGIEALSRGARFCVFIDNHEQAVNSINVNLQKCDLLNQSIVLKENLPITKDRLADIKPTANKFEIVFCDPPFADAYTLDYQYIKDLLTVDGLLVLRVPENKAMKTSVLKGDGQSSQIVKEFELIFEKQIGNSIVLFLKL